MSKIKKKRKYDKNMKNIVLSPKKYIIWQKVIFIV